jgi:hypothetical protein
VEIWERLYRGPGHRRRAVHILEGHADPASLLRRAILLIELERYEAADSVLADLTARGGDDVSTLALRAQAAFEAGRMAEGERLYWHAVDRAQADTADLLWRRSRHATPEEEVDHAVAAPEQRPSFIQVLARRKGPAPANRLLRHSRLRTAAGIRSVPSRLPITKPCHRQPFAILVMPLGQQIRTCTGCCRPRAWADVRDLDRIAPLTCATIRLARPHASFAQPKRFAPSPG